MQNNMPITGCGQSQKQKKNFNMADVCSSKPDIVIFQRCIELFQQSVVRFADFHHLKGRGYNKDGP